MMSYELFFFNETEELFRFWKYSATSKIFLIKHSQSEVLTVTIYGPRRGEKHVKAFILGCVIVMSEQCATIQSCNFFHCYSNGNLYRYTYIVVVAILWYYVVGLCHTCLVYGFSRRTTSINLFCHFSIVFLHRKIITKQYSQDWYNIIWRHYYIKWAVHERIINISWLFEEKKQKCT